MIFNHNKKHSASSPSPSPSTSTPRDTHPHSLKKNQTLSVYAVYFKDDLNLDGSFPDDITPVPVTYTSTPDQASEYCEQYNFFLNYPTFKKWCESNSYDPFFKKVWEEFIDVCPESDLLSEDFVVIKGAFDSEALAALLRLFEPSVPLGLKHEKREEDEIYQEECKTGISKIFKNRMAFEEDLRNFLKDPNNSLEENSNEGEDKDLFKDDPIS